MMLKLKLQYFGHLMGRVDSLEKTLMLGGIEGRRRRGWQRMRWLDGITGRWTWVWVNSGSWWWTGRPGVLWFMGSQRVGHDWATELNWTELIVPRTNEEALSKWWMLLLPTLVGETQRKRKNKKHGKSWSNWRMKRSCLREGCGNGSDVTF